MTLFNFYDRFKIYIDRKLDTIKPQLKALFDDYKVKDIADNLPLFKKMYSIKDTLYSAYIDANGNLIIETNEDVQSATLGSDGHLYLEVN